MSRFISIEIPDGASDADILRIVHTALGVISDPPFPGDALAAYDVTRSNIILRSTDHVVPVPVEQYGIRENIIGYFGRVAALLGANPQIAGSIQQSADMYNIGKTGDWRLDMAIQADAFACPHVYGLGQAGQPGVAAGPDPHPGTGGPDPLPPAEGGDNIYFGEHAADGVNTVEIPLNPKQVGYLLATEDGRYNAVCNGSVPVYVGIGTPGLGSGVATYDDLKAGGVWGTSQAEVDVKAGQHFCFVHEGVPGNTMRACGRKV